MLDLITRLCKLIDLVTITNRGSCSAIAICLLLPFLLLLLLFSLVRSSLGNKVFLVVVYSYILYVHYIHKKLDKLDMCIRDIIKFINFTNCRLFSNKYVHEFGILL